MATFHGLLVIDKPSGITSRAAVDRAQTWFPRSTRVGHTGTLDPLASGVLVLCIGAATRLTEYVQAMPKVYRAGITLGATSNTDDADGTILPVVFAALPQNQGEVERQLRNFVGDIQQIPPAYSAAKVTGQRAYALARKGKEVQLEPREVRIDRIDLLHYNYPHLDIEVHCGKGTYIRSLARDLGNCLGCGGYIASLRRLQIGCFTQSQAITLETDRDMAHSRMLPMWHAVQSHPPLVLLDEFANKLLQGQAIPIPDGASQGVGDIVVTDNAGRIFAVTSIFNGLLRPRKVMMLD